MSLLVVGSVALDSVETPLARRDDVLGGSAVYFSYAASFFTPVRMVGVVGEDWPGEHTRLLSSRRIDTAGLHVVPGARTFRWRGKYQPNMNDRETLEVHLNVFGDFDPQLPESFRSSPYLFLANGSPKLQAKVLDQVARPKLVVADTMDLWINIERDELMDLWKRVDGVVMNDSEAKLLTDDDNLIRAGKKALGMGPKFVVVKKGEHGAICFAHDETLIVPAFPTEQVVDPTGAGDSFAGGMMGFLASRDVFDSRSLHEALAYGAVVASYNVEDFSLDQLTRIERADLDRRLADYRRMSRF